MNNLLFYALLIALLYYFFIYLPSQKKITQKQPTLFEHKETQTETNSTDILSDPGPEIKFPSNQVILDPELEKTVDQLIKNIQKLNSEIN